MPHWTLTATYKGRTSTRLLEVYPPSYEAVRLCETLRSENPTEDATHLDMVTTCVQTILNLSAKYDAWRYGAIVATDSAGNVVETMEGKVRC